MTRLYYRKDIENLVTLTRGVASDLDERSKLRIGKSEITLTRRCVQELRRQIEDRSLVVVGDPGVGKSGALRDVVASLLQEGRDTVFLSAERIDAKTPAQLRQQLGLQHELDEILANWEGNVPAFLIFDALDALKSKQAVHTLLSVLDRIVRMRGRWRVIVSIRTLDLHRNQELRHTFAGEPPSARYQNDEFANVCHLNIPEFSEEEQSHISLKSPELKRLFEVENGPLKDLLRIPFNLRLLGELLGDGVPVSELASIRTKLELCDRYWEKRIVQPHDGLSDARLLVLWRSVTDMVEKRTLSVPRTYVAKTEERQALDRMINEHMLIEWQPPSSPCPDRTSLTFAHQGLFDYAVERLLLRVEVEFDQRIAEDPELILFFRPSVEMHFRYIWSLDTSRSHFWEMVLIWIENQQIPEFGKTIGPAIAAESLVSFFELLPLLQYFDSWRENNAVHALRYVTEALLSMERSKQTIHLVGKRAGPWAELMERLSRHLTENLTEIIRPLLMAFHTLTDVLTEEQLTFSGIAARNLLKYAWAQKPGDESLITDALRCVCRMFHSNPDASNLLLSQVLQKDHLARYGYVVIPCLAREVKHMLGHDPSFVQDLYVAAFGYEEKSEDESRRYNYQLGLEQLEASFTDFLKQAPAQAVEALIAISKQYVLTNPSLHSKNVLASILWSDNDGVGDFIRAVYRDLSAEEKEKVKQTINESLRNN